MNSAGHSSGPRVSAVLFDYGLTLVDFSRPSEAIDRAQAAIAARIAEAGHSAPPPSLLLAAVHDRVEQQVAAHQATGAVDEIDVRGLERRAFSDIGLQLDDGLLDECSRLAQEAWCDGVWLYGDAVGALERLRAAGLRLGLCSNASYRPASMRAQLVHLGLDRRLDAATFSSEVGWRKPSPRLFAAALEAVGTAALETVFVGDRLREDIAGAQASGMRAVLIDRTAHRSGADDGATATPDAVIATLAELPALLAQPRPS